MGSEELKDEKQPEQTEVIAEVSKEQISKSEPETLTIMTVGNDDPRPGQNTTVASVQMLSSATAGAQTPDDLVYVRIKYPDKWKKDRFFKDGDIKAVSKETADQFVNAGFATIVSKPE